MSYSYIFTCHLRFQNSSRNNNIIIITIKSSNNHNSNKCVWGNRRVTRWMSSVINHQNACYRSIRCKWAQWRIPQRPRHTAAQQVRSKREFNVNICNTHRERERESKRKREWGEWMVACRMRCLLVSAKQRMPKNKPHELFRMQIVQWRRNPSRRRNTENKNRSNTHRDQTHARFVLQRCGHLSV